MSARQLSQLFYAAEEVATDTDRNGLLIIEYCGSELPTSVITLLSYLIDSSKDRQGLSEACEIVFSDRKVSHFWRALAAHHRALNCQPPENPDSYFPMAMAAINPIYSRPKEEKNGDPTPEGGYIYHSRMRDRIRLGLVKEELDMLYLGATTAIHEGWFEAPDWTHEACNKLVNAGRHEHAKLLVRQLITRGHPDKPHCYFSRLGRARLMQAHGALIAT